MNLRQLRYFCEVVDTGNARGLLDLGKALADGGDAAKLKPVACR